MKKLFTFLSVLMILFSNSFSQQNIAIGKRASASNTHNTTSTSNLVDGNYNTPWNAGASATQWISVDLQDNYTISSMKLIPCQSPAGNTTHEILVTSDNNSWISIDKFTVYSSDKSPIERKFSTPINNVKSVKVITSQSPSWIAWFEIEIYGSKTISNVTTNTTGVFTDLRDNKVYKTVQIGNQTWFAENLAYKPSSGNYWTNLDTSYIVKGSYWYSWKTAQNICPTGWHLPNDEEWNTLSNSLGNTKEKVYIAIRKGGNSGFNVFNSFICTFDGKIRYYSRAGFWSSTEKGGDFNESLFMYIQGSPDLGHLTAVKRNVFGCSVRCLKN